MSKIIVEICQNHSGDRGLLRELIHSAKENGADIVKGQVIFSEDLTDRPRFNGGFVENNGVRKSIDRPYNLELARLKKLDLSEDDYHFFVEEANRIGITPMFTIFSRNRIPFVASLPWIGEKLVKVASYDCGSYKMIEELADNFDKLIISTGASFDDEVKNTAKLLKLKNKKFALLHCVTSYPNEIETSNLSRMEWLREMTPDIGWSDHTAVRKDGIKVAKVALMLGANYIERHFTILPNDQTKDGPISIDGKLLLELSKFSKLSRKDQMSIIEEEMPDWKLTLGLPNRDLTHTEMLNRDYYRGRFASRFGGEFVYNWEDKKAF